MSIHLLRQLRQAIYYPVPSMLAAEAYISELEAVHSQTLKEKEALEAQKNAVYAERDQLVSLATILYPSCLTRHQPEDDDWENDWRWVVIIELPTGQVSWHIHDSELPWFEHLPKDLYKWDGHSTQEKYERIGRMRQQFGNCFQIRGSEKE